MKIEISVVVPAHNEEKLLANCLRCLRNQDFKKPIEIIVVDNNSTDNTAKIAKSFGVKIVKENRLGVIFAKQAGLLAAKGRIVAVTDADCEPAPNWLSIIYSNLNKPGVVGVGGPVVNLGGSSWHSVYLNNSLKLLGVSKKIFGKLPYIMGGNLAFLRKEIIELGGYNVQIRTGEDEWGILEKMQKKGEVIFDYSLINFTSPRRSSHGPIIFFKDVVFYILKYHLTRYLKIEKFNYQWEIIR